MAKKAFKRGRQLNAAILSLREEKIVQGKLGEVRDLVDEDGKPRKGKMDQDLWVFEMVDPDSGEVRIFWGDGGLKGAFKLANVRPGQLIEIEHTGEREHVGDFDATLQIYAIYPLEVA